MTEFRKSPCNLLEDTFVLGRQVVFDKQMTMFKQIRLFLFETFILACRTFGLLAGRTPPSAFRLLSLYAPSYLGQGLQHLLIDFLHHMKLTDLMFNIAKHRLV